MLLLLFPRKMCSADSDLTTSSLGLNYLPHFLCQSFYIIYVVDDIFLFIFSQFHIIPNCLLGNQLLIQHHVTLRFVLKAAYIYVPITSLRAAELD